MFPSRHPGDKVPAAACVRGHSPTIAAASNHRSGAGGAEYTGQRREAQGVPRAGDPLTGHNFSMSSKTRERLDPSSWRRPQAYYPKDSLSSRGDSPENRFTRRLSSSGMTRLGSEEAASVVTRDFLRLVPGNRH